MIGPMKSKPFGITRLWILCALSASVFAFAGTASAADALLSDDTIVLSRQAKTNFGEHQFFRLTAGSEVYLKWDLSSLPAFSEINPVMISSSGLTILKATLRLYIRQVKKEGSFDIYTPAADWNEETLTYANKPAISSGVECCIDITKADENTEKVIDVTNLVNNWWMNQGLGMYDSWGLPNFGIVLVPGNERSSGIAPATTATPTETPTPTSSIDIILSSKESPTYTYPARLEITFGSEFFR